TAETNRTPFDLPEAEQELIGGFLTEYSGLKFTMYYLAEYLNVITVAALATLLFFGGWYLWVVPPVFAFFIKVVLVVFLYIWLRGTYPRLRYDTLMRLGWKVLLPLALANVVVTAIVLVAVQGYGMADEEKDQKPKPQSVASDIAALMSGLKTTLAETFRPVVTTMYPEEKTPRSERYRGRHYLRRYDNGLERCIGCELCAAACPVGCILVIAAENTDENRVSPGERYAKTY